MNLHNEIMNIQAPASVERMEPRDRLSYKSGLRDARHAAAELAVQHESAAITLARAEITALQGEVEGLRAEAAKMRIALERAQSWMGCIESVEYDRSGPDMFGTFGLTKEAIRAALSHSVIGGADHG